MKKIGWVVPDSTTESSGGVFTIWNHIRYLSDLYEQDVYVSKTWLTEEDNLKNIYKYYGQVNNVNIIYGHENIKQDYYDLLIATYSLHAYKVRNASAKKKAYFIQDLEYTFFPMSSEYLWAKESYTYDLIPITIGKYMQRVLRYDYPEIKKYPQYYFDFTVDTDIYKVLPENIKDKENSICFLYQPEKSRRCSQIGLQALKLIYDAVPHLHVYLYGSKDVCHHLEKYPEFFNMRLIKRERCNLLYNNCQVTMIFSSTNPSRIPFEAMAAGSCVVDLDLDNKDDFDHGLLTVGKTPEEIAKKVIDLFNNKEKMENISKRGVEFAKNRTHKLAIDQFRKIISEIVE